MSRESTCERRVPFSVVDEAVYLLDNEVEPWSVQLEVRVEGRLDETRLRTALAEALAAHPMARARKATSRRRDKRFQWEITHVADLDPFSVVDCPDDDALSATRADLQSISIPLVESPPLRVRLARHPDGDLVMMNVKHAAIDGFGSLRILRSMARAYWGLPDPQPDLDLEVTRDLRHSLAADDAAEKGRRVMTLLDKLRDEVHSDRRPGRRRREREARVRLPPRQPVARDDQGAGCGRGRDRQRRPPGRPAPGPGRLERRARRPGKRVGVMMPVNLRPKEWREEMAGNFSLNVRVATTPSERESPDSLLAAIAEQSKRIKEGGTGAALIEALGGLPALPVWAKHAGGAARVVLRRPARRHRPPVQPGKGRRAARRSVPMPATPPRCGSPPPAACHWASRSARSPPPVECTSPTGTGIPSSTPPPPPASPTATPPPSTSTPRAERLEDPGR